MEENSPGYVPWNNCAMVVISLLSPAATNGFYKAPNSQQALSQALPKKLRRKNAQLETADLKSITIRFVEHN